MEAVKNKIRNLSMHKYFTLTVFTTFCVVAALSAIVIWGCISLRNYLMPDSNYVYLTVSQTFSDGTQIENMNILEIGAEEQELPKLTAGQGEDFSDNERRIIDEKYTIKKIESRYDALTPKRKLVYNGCGVIMIAVPATLSIAGILICGVYFYRRKFSIPFRLLTDATKQIAQQNLEFSIDYSCEDEMGMLCRSLEQMREALAQNNKKMWEMLEQRKLMQSSIAHDLRNPIAIIEGYTEYLKINFSKGSLKPEKAERILNNLYMAAKRLEQYTESVRTVNQMEDMEIKYSDVDSEMLIDDIYNDFEIMASNEGKTLNIKNSMPKSILYLDMTALYRILENVFGNALRFAKNEVCLNFELNSQKLCITVTDDGNGFSEEVLNGRGKLFLPTHDEGHMGMGLTLSRLMCEKHGGGLEIFNNASHNGVVKIILKV